MAVLDHVPEGWKSQPIGIQHGDSGPYTGRILRQVPEIREGK